MPQHRSFRTALIGAALLAAGALPAAAQEMSVGQAQLVRALLPTVVNITARAQVRPTPEPVMASASGGGTSAASGRVRVLVNAGSGFVIDPSGEIATNWHVVVNAYDIVVTFADGSRASAELLSASPLVDLAVIKVNVGHRLPAAHWGDSSKVQVGDPVLAMGNPLGVGLSVSAGIVSALNRNIMDTPYDDFIQTDAAINHGNSGGPLFDMKGEVIGVNSAIISPTSGNAGLGFSMPSNDARFIIERLTHKSWARPGYLGAKLQEVTPEMANALGLPAPAGSIVAEVEDGSPAGKAGLRPGDVILRYAGEAPGDERALLRAIARTEPGAAVPIVIRRDGQQTELTAQVAEWPVMWWESTETGTGAAPHFSVPHDLGLMVGPLDTAMRASYGVRPEATSGVVVTGVLPGTDAAQRGVSAGDVIVQVNGTAIDSAADLQREIDRARADGRSFALFLVQRKNQGTTAAQHPSAKWLALSLAPS